MKERSSIKLVLLKWLKFEDNLEYFDFNIINYRYIIYFKGILWSFINNLI